MTELEQQTLKILKPVFRHKVDIQEDSYPLPTFGHILDLDQWLLKSWQ